MWDIIQAMEERKGLTRQGGREAGLSVPGGRPLTGFLCCQGWEETLAAELERAFPGCSPEASCQGLVTCLPRPDIVAFDSVFARERLPGLVFVDGDSVKSLVQGIGSRVDATLDSTGGSWTVRFFTPDAHTFEGTAFEELRGRVSLLEEQFMARMETFRKRAMTRFRPWYKLRDAEENILVQVLLVSRNHVGISISTVPPASAGKPFPRLFPDVRTGVADDPLAPCRSYYKLEEAWLESGARPSKNQLCVDLGAAPGGWTWSALKRGARVIAVDAADLAPNVASHPMCEHLRDNGFSYAPPRTADWLFCDMIVKPMATLGLLERWLEAGWCRGFVVNVKFRGRNPVEILEKVAQFGERFSRSIRVRHLFFDRNEVTLISPPTTRRPQNRP